MSGPGGVAVHVWVELPGDVVFESITQQFFDRTEYYRVMQNQSIASYTPEDLAEMFDLENWTLTSEIAAEMQNMVLGDRVLELIRHLEQRAGIEADVPSDTRELLERYGA